MHVFHSKAAENRNYAVVFHRRKFIILGEEVSTIIINNNCHLLTAYYVPSTVLPALHPTFPLILNIPYEMGISIPVLEKKLRCTMSIICSR